MGSLAWGVSVWFGYGCLVLHKLDGQDLSPIPFSMFHVVIPCSSPHFSAPLDCLKTRVRSLSVIFLGLKNVSVFSKFVQVVIIRELNNVAGKPSDRASPWTMEEHKVPQAVKFSFPIL